MVILKVIVVVSGRSKRVGQIGNLNDTILIQFIIGRLMFGASFRMTCQTELSLDWSRSDRRGIGSSSRAGGGTKADYQSDSQ